MCVLLLKWTSKQNIIYTKRTTLDCFWLLSFKILPIETIQNFMLLVIPKLAEIPKAVQPHCDPSPGLLDHLSNQDARLQKLKLSICTEILKSSSKCISVFCSLHFSIMQIFWVGEGKSVLPLTVDHPSLQNNHYNSSQMWNVLEVSVHLRGSGSVQDRVTFIWLSSPSGSPR